MVFSNFKNQISDRYLYSTNFNRLCECLGISDEDKTDIIKATENNSCLDETVLLIYDKVYQTPSKEFSYKGDLKDKFSEMNYYKYIVDKDRWWKISLKITSEINIGKINSFYHLEKSFYNLLGFNKLFIAKASILISVIESLNDEFWPSWNVKKYLMKNILKKFLDNPLQYSEIREYYEKSYEKISSGHFIKLSEYENHFGSFFLIENNDLAQFFDNLISKDEDYDVSDVDYLLVYGTYWELGTYYIVLACGLKNDDEIYIKERETILRNFLIKKTLLHDSPAIEVHYNLEDYKNFINEEAYDFELDLEKLSETFYDDFKLYEVKNKKNNKSWFVAEKLDEEEIELVDDETFDSSPKNLKEVVLKKPLCEEFFEILSLLDLDLSFAYQLQEFIGKDDDSEDAYYYLNRKILEDEDLSRDILSSADLNKYFDDYEIKTILLHCEDSWDEIKRDLQSQKIKSLYDLNFEYFNHHLVKGGSIKKFKANILHQEIKTLVDFREIDDKEIIIKLAYYLRDLDIYSNSLYEFFDNNLNENYNPMPKSLDEAVDYLIVNSSPEFIDSIYNCEKSDMRMLHLTLGMWIRNEFGLNNGGNIDLINDLDCMISPDSGSSQILYALWEKVQENYDDVINNIEFKNTIDMYKYML